MNSTAAIFDLITRSCDENATQIVLDHYRMVMQNQVEIHF